MSKSKAKKKYYKNMFSTIKNILTTWIPIVISLIALYYTYSIDKRDSTEKLKINIVENFNQDNIELSYDEESNHSRIAVKKSIKIDIINNSKSSIIIDRIKETNNHTIQISEDWFCTGHTSYELSYNNYNGESMETKSLPFSIDGQDFKTIHSNFSFLLGQKSTDFIKDKFMKKSLEISIRKDSLDFILSKNNIPYFEKEGDENNETIFEYELTTSNNNIFKRKFSYNYNYWSNFQGN